MPTQKTSVPNKSRASSRDPNLLATLAHLSILAVFFMGPFSMLIPLLIWLSERNKHEPSPFVEFQAKQAFFYQVAVYIISAFLGIIIGILSIILIGLLFIPVLIIFILGAVVYGVYAGIQVSHDEEFRYIFIADFIEA